MSSNPTTTALAVVSLLLVTLTGTVAVASPVPQNDSNPLDRALDSIALVLYGAGAGRLTGVAAGAIVQSNGIILTDCGQLDEAREVQVRLRNGEVFDQVTLLGIDRRRCVAALKIHATQLPALATGSADALPPASRIYAVRVNDNGVWSLLEGSVTGYTTADDSNLGETFGHRLMLVSLLSDLNPPYTGQPDILLDAEGRLLGVVRRHRAPRQAVPIQAVLGLAEHPAQTALGEGRALDLERSRSLSAHEVASADPERQLLQAHTLHVSSSSVFIKPSQLHQALLKHPEFKQWELKLVEGYQAAKIADLTVQLDRPLFTYYFTFDLTDNQTGIVLGSGKVTALDGNAAAPLLAKKIVEILAKAKKEKDAPPPQAPSL